MKLRRIKRRARVEMLPLMDVVFLLLVFFIYSMMSMSAHRALPLSLPSSAQAQADSRPALSLSISAEGALYLEAEPVPLEGLAEVLRQKRAGQPEASLKVFADKDLSYEALYRVLDEIQLSGFTKVGLQAGPSGAASAGGAK